jgi:hypothetical protein
MQGEKNEKMTDKELVNRAKTLRGNLLLDGERINFADACKIVLLAQVVDNNDMLGDKQQHEFNNAIQLYKSARPWWRLFW